MQKFVVVKRVASPGRTEALTSASSDKIAGGEPASVMAKDEGGAKRSRATAGTADGTAPAPQLQVKMSGYLKKKRKKMGGWRKLWFVLQNQLLLSYSSQEDYERRLVSFKDVVSLVPGTIIRPTKGPRFIIETSSNLIYTYRCDDNKTCSEWITALVESLSMGAQVMLDNKLHLNQTKRIASPENSSSQLKSAATHKTKPSTGSVSTSAETSASSSPSSAGSSAKRQISASRSWDSICRAQGPPNTHRASPNLPIVLSTARILRRHGMPQQRPPLVDVREAFRETRRSMIETPTPGVPAVGSEQHQDDSGERVRNFRLHHPVPSNEAVNNTNHPNNYTEHTSSSNNNNNHRQPNPDVPDAKCTAVLIRRSTRRRQSNSRDVVLRINSMFVRSRRIPGNDADDDDVVVVVGPQTPRDTDFHDDDEYGGYAVPEFGRKSADNHNHNNNNNNNNSSSHNNNETTVKPPAKADGSPRKPGPWSAFRQIGDHRRTASFEDRLTHSSLHEDVSDRLLGGPHSIRSPPTANRFSPAPPSSLAVQLAGLQLRPPHALSHTNLREVAERRMAGAGPFASDHALQTTWKQTVVAAAAAALATDDGVTGNAMAAHEPIYAVVNLREKYARRAKRQQKMLSDEESIISGGYSGIGGMDSLNEYQLPRERPKSCNVAGSDYEEVMEFRSGLDIRTHEDENENIYEPINVQPSDEPLLSPRSPMWRYFSRINIDALVEIAKRRRPTVITCAATAPDLSVAADAADRKPHDSTAFVADIRKRWGNHRKSIKNRMKRFYGRDHSHRKHIETASDDDLGSQAASCSTSSANSDTSGGGPHPDRTATDDDDGPSSFVLGEIEKYRKGEKHIFGSLGRLRKPRPSLCLDLDAVVTNQKSSACGGCVRKRANGVGSSERRGGGAAGFHSELKLEVSRRCGAAAGPKKKDQCHSQFYD